MKLNIIGIGACQADDFEEKDLEQSSTIKVIPVRNQMPKHLISSSGRLAKLAYLAGLKALEDAKLKSPYNLTVAFASGLSEIESLRKALVQIHDSKESELNPISAQNTFFNAPAEILSIALNNSYPHITFGHSFLSAEMAVDYAFTFLPIHDYSEILLISGDQFLVQWIDTLNYFKQNEYSELLMEKTYQEGVSAFVLSSEPSHDTNYGSFVNSCVIHLPGTESLSKTILGIYGFNINHKTIIMIREGFRDKIPQAKELSNILNIPQSNIHVYNTDEKQSMSSPLSNIAHLDKDKGFDDILFISSEYNDIAILHYQVTR